MVVRVNTLSPISGNCSVILESEENKMNRQDYLELKNNMPSFYNGRKVKLYYYGSKGAQRILLMASSFEGNKLEHVYKKPSMKKQRAFADVYQMYLNDESASGFKICSHNCQSFSVSWSTPTCVEFLTSKTEHIVVF